MTSSRFIAFFGATGGCTNAALVHTLNAGLHATTLARTPSKLIDMLTAQGITQPVLDAQLTIVQGDVTDIPAIKSVLVSSKHNNTLASQIISGVGGVPQFQFNIKKPVTIDNPKICATTVQNIAEALRQIILANEQERRPELATTTTTTTSQRPSIVVISTTGLSSVREDVPFGFQTLYHIVLADPHADKKEMENFVTKESVASDPEGVFSGAIVVRPSLLTGDQNVKGGKGWKTLRVGKEEEPAIGYTIHRADVGEWIFEETIRSTTTSKTWFGQRVTLTS
ncbi:hypothetical protein BG004_005931 [Podila humilis]|nr:hypothetical protein BG004_005931 [Podila humilis]